MQACFPEAADGRLKIVNQAPAAPGLKSPFRGKGRGVCDYPGHTSDPVSFPVTLDIYQGFFLAHVNGNEARAG